MTAHCRWWYSRIAVAGWVALAACSSCLGATGSTEVFTTGTYAAQGAAPDYMTTTDPQGRALKVTYGIATPVCPADQGKVVIDWDLTSGPTAAFVLRTTGWGCAYAVYGVWDGTGGGGGGGEPATWNSDFDAENAARIVLEVNEDGLDDDWVRLGGGGTLKVYVLGGPSVDYTVHLVAGSGVCFNEEGGPDEIDVIVAGNGNEYQYTPAVLYGQSAGYTTIDASCPGSPVAAAAQATVAVVSAFNYRPGPTFVIHSIAPPVPPAQSSLKASPGEKMLFGISATDDDEREPVDSAFHMSWDLVKGTGPYKIEWTCSAQAEFDAVGSTKRTKDTDGLSSGTVKLFIKGDWTGTTDIDITAVIKDNAPAVVAPDTGSKNDADVTFSWRIQKRGTPPLTLTRVEGPLPTKWVPPIAKYRYRGDPELNPPGRPCYEWQLVLEEFADCTALGFDLNDLTETWMNDNMTQNQLVTKDDVAKFLFSSGDNGSFAFDNEDKFADGHGFGMTTKAIAAFKPTAFNDADGVGYRLPQTYSCAGTSIGHCNIDRRLKGKSDLKIMKSEPAP